MSSKMKSTTATRSVSAEWVSKVGAVVYKEWYASGVSTGYSA